MKKYLTVIIVSLLAISGISLGSSTAMALVTNSQPSLSPTSATAVNGQLTNIEFTPTFSVEPDWSNGSTLELVPSGTSSCDDLPNGLSLDGGPVATYPGIPSFGISGIPAATAGNYNVCFDVKVSDGQGSFDEYLPTAVTVTVVDTAFVLTPETTNTFLNRSTESRNFTLSQGFGAQGAALDWALGGHYTDVTGLPSGLSFGTQNPDAEAEIPILTISGTAIALPQEYSVTVTVQDSNGIQVSAPITIEVTVRQCEDYSSAPNVGSAILLNPDGTVIGCDISTQPAEMIPTDWDVNFNNWYHRNSENYSPRLGFACDDCWVGKSGYNSQDGFPLGFTLNFQGTIYDHVFVNSNGSIAFGNGSSEYSAPLDEILDGSAGVVAYGADLDNRDVYLDGNDFIYWGATTLNGHTAFVATWMNVGSYNDRTDLHTFQIVLEDLGRGNVDIQLNYGSMLGCADGYGYNSGIVTNCGYGGPLVGIGIGAPNREGTLEFASLQNDQGFLYSGLINIDLNDGGTTPLIQGTLNSAIPGQFIFQLRNGSLPQIAIEPTAPQNAYSLSHGDISLFWDAPLSDGGSAITGYVVEYRAVGDTSWLSETAAASDRALDLSGLNTGTYEIRIAAENAVGTSEFTSVITGTAGGTNTSALGFPQGSPFVNTVTDSQDFAIQSQVGYDWSGGGTITLSSLPQGLSYQVNHENESTVIPSFTILGTPADTAGNYDVTVTLSDSLANSASYVLVLAVVDPVVPSFTTSDGQFERTVNSTQHFSMNNLVGFNWNTGGNVTVSQLPAGLSASVNFRNVPGRVPSLDIYGTTSVASGSYVVTLTLNDGFGHSAQHAISLIVANPVVPEFALNGTGNIFNGIPATNSLEIVNDSGFNWATGGSISITGLPSGVSWSVTQNLGAAPALTLNGTADDTPGSFTATVTLLDDFSHIATQTFLFTLENLPDPEFSLSGNRTFLQGISGSKQFTLTNVQGYEWSGGSTVSVSGLPHGLSFEDLSVVGHTPVFRIYGASDDQIGDYVVSVTVEDNFNNTSTQNMTVTVREPVFAVTYNPGAGTVVQTSGSFTVGGSPLVLPKPVYEGHVFRGWFTSSTDGTLIGFSGAEYSPEDDVTLFAQWSSITPSIEIVSNNSSQTISTTNPLAVASGSNATQEDPNSTESDASTEPETSQSTMAENSIWLILLIVIMLLIALLIAWFIIAQYLKAKSAHSSSNVEIS